MGQRIQNNFARHRSTARASLQDTVSGQINVQNGDAVLQWL